MSDKSASEEIQNTANRATHGEKDSLQSFSSYLKSSKATWYLLTIATAAITTIAVFLIQDFSPWIYFRNVFGTIFILWLPGYALTKLLLPQNIPAKASTETLEKIVRITLSIGASIAIVIVIGLLLNYSPWGINLVPIILALLTFTVIIATAAAFRDYLSTSTPKHELPISSL